MQKFLEFDPKFNITRLPLTYSIGDLSSIRETFTPEYGDIGRTQLPILPPKTEMIISDEREIQGYLIEACSALVMAIREFLKGTVSLLDYKNRARHDQRMNPSEQYTKVKNECMNRIGTRLVEVIKQERRLGLYNLFWLMISKHLVTFLDQVIPAKGDKQTHYKLAMHPIITQAFQETLQKVRLCLHKEDEQKQRYSQYINETIASHLGTAFNYEFSQSILNDQIHLLFPTMSWNNPLEYAQAVFTEHNEKYHITYNEFVEIYSGARSYAERRLRKGDPVFREMLANVLRIPPKTVGNISMNTIVFHPTLISLFVEELKQLPAKTRKKIFFKSWSTQLGNIFGEGSWEFAMTDYLTFAKDLRRSEIVAFFRNRIVLAKKTQPIVSGGLSRVGAAETPTSGIADKISYQFEQGRIINDLRGVTLVFLDLRGFTELSAGNIGDQELKEHLYHFFDPVVNIINSFGGTIKNYVGDGILASFDIDSRYKNHALDAVRAALEIQKLFKMLKQEEKTIFRGMGIGIHTGLVEEAYFFPNLEVPSYNTVIGLAANLVGRLSSGKAEKRRKLDILAAFSLHERLISSSTLDSSLLLNIERQLLQALETLENEQEQSSEEQNQQQQLMVKVIQGILNNQGIAISGVEHGTFEKIRSSVELHKIEFPDSVRYTFFDDVLHEQLVFIKAGDASFKGIDTGTQGKFPVWGVYLEQDLH